MTNDKKLLGTRDNSLPELPKLPAKLPDTLHVSPLFIEPSLGVESEVTCDGEPTPPDLTSPGDLNSQYDPFSMK